MPSPSLLRFEPLPALPVLSTRSTTEHHVSYWKAFERIRGRWRRRAIQIIARRFEIEREVVVGAVRRGTHAGDAMVLAEMAIAAGAKGWRETLYTLYREVGGDFATRIFDRLMDDEDDGEIETLGMAVRERKDARPQITDRWWLTVRSWLDQEAGKRITGITETTRRQVMAQLREGVGAGEGIPQLARRVNRLYEDEFTLRRSVMIARTEVISASNLGSRAGALSTGLELEKTWIATFDDRTREAHLFANGQTVPMDEPYVVAGERLMFPGDTSLGASARNVVLCRCTEGYRKIRSA